LLNQFFAKNSLPYLILSLLVLSVFILQGTRQLIVAFLFLTLVNLFFAKRIRSKGMIMMVIVFSVFAVVLLFREIFIELTRVSSSQMQNLGGGVRMRAADFYLTEFTPNIWAHLFGNSNAGFGSQYNQAMLFNALKYGFYTTDIGILGDYFKYGIIFAVTGLYLVVKAIRFNISKELLYLKFYILSQCFTLLTGFGIFGGVDILLLLALYIFDVDQAKRMGKLHESVPGQNKQKVTIQLNQPKKQRH
jgi:hypothetical protein